MKLTGAFLAERAEAVNGALSVEGGVVAALTQNQQSGMMDVCLVLLVQGEPENPDKTVKIAIEPLSAPVESVQPQLLTETVSDESLLVNAGGFSILELSFEKADLPVDGIYTMTVTGPDHSISLLFNVGTI
jgi:hypothetical protein